jgi:hypothetical protein
MKILTGEHVITGDEYFRQKEFCPYDSDNFAVSTFISKWASIKYLVGVVWKGKKLKELDYKSEHYPCTPSFLQQYEFVQLDDGEENLVEIYSEEQMKEKNERMYLCKKMLWND